MEILFILNTFLALLFLSDKEVKNLKQLTFS